MSAIVLAARPARRYHPMVKIARYHELPAPICVRCGWLPPIASWREAGGAGLERAHIIDRVFDGLDVLANLAPLCGRCHRGQPIFQPGDERRALAWFGLPVGQLEGKP